MTDALTTIALADALKERVEQHYRDAVARRGEAQAAHYAAIKSDEPSMAAGQRARYAIEQVRICEDARTTLAALTRILEQL